MRVAQSQESLSRLLSEEATAATVPCVHVPIAEAQLPDPNLVLAGLVTIRENGFMLVIPHTEVSHQAVEALEPIDAGEGPLFYQGTVTLANTRGKAVGPSMVELVDLPWAYAECIFNSMQFRGAAAQQFKVLGFATQDGKAGKPLRESARELSTLWIGEMDADTAQEYISAAEAPMDPGLDGDPVEEEDEVAKLQEQVRQLQQELQQRSRTTVPLMPTIQEQQALTPFATRASSRASGVFDGGNPGPHLTPGEWEKLKTMAGSPPPRVAAAENRRSQVPPQVQAQEALFADIEREAIEEDLGMPVDPVADCGLDHCGSGSYAISAPGLVAAESFAAAEAGGWSYQRPSVCEPSEEEDRTAAPEDHQAEFAGA